MAATIKIKNSSTTGAVPTSSDLVQGELAVNVTDTGLYTENASGTVVKLNAPSIDDKNTGATKHLTISTGGNLGLGVTPSSWASGTKAFEVGQVGNALYGFSSTNLFATQNAYYNGTNWIFASSNRASYYQQNSGLHTWSTSTASGTAGGTISWTQAMTLDASGNLGIGTTSPAAPLHVSSANLDTNAFRFVSTTGTNASAGRFTNTGGNAYVGLDNSTGSRISGSSGAGYSLNVWHEGAYPVIFGTSNAERARIDSSGNLLVGKTTSSETAANGFIAFSNGQVTATTANQNTFNFYNTTAGAYRFYVTGAGQINATSTSIAAISDASLKENVRDLETGLSEVMALRPRRFDWKEETGIDQKDVAGFIAQELELVLPELVYEYQYNETNVKKSIKMGDILPTLVKAIQEQQAIITALTARIEALEQA